MEPRLAVLVAIAGLLVLPAAPASAQIWVGTAPSCDSDAYCHHPEPESTGTAARFRVLPFHDVLGDVESDPGRRPPGPASTIPSAPEIGTLRITRDRSWPDGLVVVPRNMLQATYDRPIPGSGFAVTGGSAVSDRPAPHHADTWVNAARSHLGLAFNRPGLRLSMAPAVEQNWGPELLDRTQYSLTSQFDLDLTRDFTVSLYSRYEGYSFSDEWRNYDELRRFVTGSYRLGDGYAVSLAAREISGTNHWEDWSLTGPALRFDLPVADRVVLSLDSELLRSERDFHDGFRPPTGYHRNHKLQASWSPAAFAKYALNVTLDYTLHHDTAAEQKVAYHNLARFAVRMTF